MNEKKGLKNTLILKIVSISNNRFTLNNIFSHSVFKKKIKKVRNLMKPFFFHIAIYL